MNIHLKNLKKEFKTFTLGPVDLSCSNSDCMVIFGPNGSGKSTLFQLMTGNLDANDGTIEIDGQVFLPDHFLTKRKMGYLPQGLELPQWVTAEELLRYAVKLHELVGPEHRVIESLQTWDLTSFKTRPIAACSYGMQKRIGLALATIHDPALLILDEPFSGLDILHLRALNQYLSKRKNSDRITIISTHGTAYVNRLCNRALIMIEGSLSELSQWESWSSDQKEEEIEKRFH